MKTQLILALLASVRSQIHCPQQSWALYKNVREGFWSFSLPSSENNKPVAFEITRLTNYRCTGNNLQFVTTRFATVGFGQNVSRSNYRIFHTNLNTNACTQQCDSKSATVTLEFSRRFFSNNNKVHWSMTTAFGSFVFAKKNCDKLYWTSWTTTSNCRTSRQLDRVRNCTDCDGDYVDPHYCNGRFSSQTQCQPVWSEWSEAGDCISSGCHSTGKRIRTRKCLYGDGSEALNVQLCSNALSNTTETIEVNILQNNCKSCTIDSNSLNSNVSLYIGIGIASIVLVLLCFLTVYTLCRRSKSRSIRHNTSNKQNINIDHHVYDKILESGYSKPLKYHSSSLRARTSLNGTRPNDENYLSPDDINTLPSSLNLGERNKVIEVSERPKLKLAGEDEDGYLCPMSGIPVSPGATATVSATRQLNCSMDGYEVPLGNRKVEADVTYITIENQSCS